MNNTTVLELEYNTTLEQVYLGLMIGGPMYLTIIVMVIIFAIKQHVDMLRIRQEEERMFSRIQGQEHRVLSLPEVEDQQSSVNGTGCLRLGTPHYSSDSSEAQVNMELAGQGTSDLHEVDSLAIHFLRSYPGDDNYVYLDVAYLHAEGE